MRNFVASRLNEIGPSPIRKYFGYDVPGTISLGVGDPDLELPDRIVDVVTDFVSRRRVGYSHTYGRLDTREAVSTFFSDQCGLDYDPMRSVLITTGVSGGLTEVFMATMNPGSLVLIPKPGFVSYEPIVRLLGGVPISVNTRYEEGWKLTPQRLEEAISHIDDKRTLTHLILNFPNNPTGRIMDAEDLQGIAGFAEKHDLLVVADEVYSQLVYEPARHVCFASLPGMKDRTVVLDGVSKGYTMTGFRIGFALGPHEVIKAMAKVHSYVVMVSPTIGQVAAKEAITNGSEETVRTRGVYQARRDVLVQGLHDAGMECFSPKGSLYCFPMLPQITGLELSSERYCDLLLERAKVVLIPGTGFGASAEGFARACFAAASREKCIEATGRIAAFNKDLRAGKIRVKEDKDEKIHLVVTGTGGKPSQT